MASSEQADKKSASRPETVFDTLFEAILGKRLVPRCNLCL